jgi:nitrite reductase (NADH) small subunit
MPAESFVSIRVVLKMAEHIIGPAASIPVGEGRVVEVGRHSIGVFNIEGTFYALRNVCPHQGGPACDSRLFDQIEAEVLPSGKVREFVEQEKCIIACPWHGIEFDARTGECLTKKDWKIKQYTVYVNEDDHIVIQLP